MTDLEGLLWVKAAWIAKRKLEGCPDAAERIAARTESILAKWRTWQLLRIARNLYRTGRKVKRKLRGRR
jgi:hypothetical protein